jgi:hypothetical protein
MVISWLAMAVPVVMVLAVVAWSSVTGEFPSDQWMGVAGLLSLTYIGGIVGMLATGLIWVRGWAFKGRQRRIAATQRGHVELLKGRLITGTLIAGWLMAVVPELLRWGLYEIPRFLLGGTSRLMYASPVPGEAYWAVPIGMVLLVVGGLMHRRNRKARAAERQVCPTCGYLLWGLPEPRCPECGERTPSTGEL